MANASAGDWIKSQVRMNAECLARGGCRSFSGSNTVDGFRKVVSDCLELVGGCCNSEGWVLEGSSCVNSNVELRRHERRVGRWPSNLKFETCVREQSILRKVRPWEKAPNALTPSRSLASTHMSVPERGGYFATYKNALKVLSTRTGTPLPSLLVSFGILHELTAIVPLVGVFYGARALGVGERIIAAVVQGGFDSGPKSHNLESHPIRAGWVGEQCRTWLKEGENWAGRVGRRYGVFGFEKRILGSGNDTAPDVNAMSMHISGQVAGDVANAVVAYGVTKVCFLLMHTPPNFLQLKLGPDPTSRRPIFIPVACIFSAYRRAIP